MLECDVDSRKRFRPSVASVLICMSSLPITMEQVVCAACRPSAVAHLYGEGRLSREEYRRRIDHNENLRVKAKFLREQGLGYPEIA